MSKDFIEVTGFQQLQDKLKSISNDKVKEKEVLKLLGQLANPMVKAVKDITPVSKKVHIQKRKKQKFGTYIKPGTGKKSIGKTIMRKARNPTIYISPRSTKRADGWYLRQFVIKGTKNIASNNFVDRAHRANQGTITKSAEVKIAKYIQKQIDRLSNA